MKKILAILLSVVMLLGCVVISTAADENDATAFEIGAGVNVIPVADENVVKTFGSLATITDCDYGKAWSELRTGDKLEFVIDVETAGTYYFSLAYAWGGKSSFTLAVDGTDAATIVCPTTGGWSAPIAVNDPTAVELAAGAHDITLTLTEPDGGLNSFFAINICDSADAEITYPIWRYAASAMPGAATGAKDAAGQTVAYHANVLQAFDGFYFSMATWSVSTAYCKIAVYKWAYNYENTLAGEPIATAEFNPMADNTANGIDFDEALPAGEYLFYIYDTSAEKCGIYCYEGADEKGVTYVGGVVDSTWIPGLGIKINAGFGEGTEILGVASAEVKPPVEPETTAPETTAPVEPEPPVEPEEPAYDIEGGKANFVPVVGNSDYTVQIAEIACCAHGQMLVDLRSGDVLNFKVNIKEAGTYDLSFGYIWGWGTDFKVSVDGAEEVVVPANTFVNWSTVSLSSAVKYTFTEGVHDIKVTMGGASHLYAFNICAENTTVAYPLVSRSVLGNIASNHPHGVGSSNFGFRTVISAPFTAFEMYMPTWTAKDAYCSIALYKWAGDYATTLAGSPVATKTFNPMTDGAWNGIYFDTALDAGEYLFYIYDASAQNCGIWVYKSDDYVADGYTLIGNTEYTNQAPNLRVILETPPADNVFRRGEAAETYVYVNSLDGEVLYTGNVALGEITDAMLAQLNAYANGTYNTFVKFELLSEEDGTYTFYSIHNTEADVTVNGGEAEEKDGYYVLTADAPEEGKYFAGWYIGDVLLSYSETFKFFPNVATADLVAKYDTEAPAKNSDVGVKVDRTSDKLTVSVFPIYGDNAIVEFGYYVATSTEPMDAAAVIANGKKLDSHAPHAYMVRVHDLLETTKAQNIYIVGYFTYNDGEAIKTKPTDVIVVEVPNA